MPTIEGLRELVSPGFIVALGVASVVMLVASLVVTPIILVRLPKDYFKHEKPHLIDRIRQEGAWRGGVLVMKNVLAVVLLIAGFLMLFLPGQGLLTMLIAMILMDFPNKAALERRVLALPKIRETINWLRKRRGHEPLDL